MSGGQVYGRLECKAKKRLIFVCSCVYNVKLCTYIFGPCVQELLRHPAHLAVFLNYVISNADPAPLLFYLITETYKQGAGN
jgi:hypothetical protein